MLLYSVYYISVGSSTSAPVVKLQRNSTTGADGSRPGWPVPEALITVVRAPDDGCQHPKHVDLQLNNESGW